MWWMNLVLVVVVAAVLWKAMAIVPPGNVFIVERMGKFNRVLHPGMNVIVPFVDSISRRYSMAKSTLAIAQAFRTKDEQDVQITVSVECQLLDPVRVRYASGGDLADSLKSIVVSALSKEAERQTADNLIGNRALLGESVRSSVAPLVDTFGVWIAGCTVDSVERVSLFK